MGREGGGTGLPAQPHTDPRPPLPRLARPRDCRPKWVHAKWNTDSPRPGLRFEAGGKWKQKRKQIPPSLWKCRPVGRGGGGDGISCSVQYPAASQPMACGLPDHPLEPLRPLKPGPPPQPDIPVDRSGSAWPPSTAAGGCTSQPMLAHRDWTHTPPLPQFRLPERLLHKSSAL